MSKEKEYELIKIAKPSIRAQRLLYNKKNQKFFARHPKLRQGVDKIGKQGLKAQRLLLEHNYRLIVHIAKKLQGRGLSWEDMVQHGSDGFLYAVSRFDVSTNNKLSTYASQWIRQRISRAIENTGRLIRIPIHMQAKINEIRYIYRKYLQDNNQEKPTSDEIAALYNLNSRKRKTFKPITKEEAEELGRHIQDITSLDESAGEDDNLSVMHYVRDENLGLELQTELSSDQKYLNKLVALLPFSSSQQFIKFRYGLVDGVHKSDIRVSEAFQMPFKAVREEEAKILAELAKLADIKDTNLDREVEIFSVIVHVAEPEGIKWLNEEMGFNITSLPAKIYESPDRDQMVILQARLLDWGIRTSLISSFL